MQIIKWFIWILFWTIQGILNQLEELTDIS